jgi:arylsulfatase A-like enzyme
MGEELRGGTSVARFARAAWAGALGGALAGVGEAVAAIVAVDSSERWPLVHLAVTGALIGGAVGMPAGVSRRWGAPAAAALAFLLLGVNAARFEVRGWTQGTAPISWLIAAMLVVFATSVVVVGGVAALDRRRQGVPAVLAALLAVVGGLAATERDPAAALDAPGPAGDGAPVLVLLVDTLRADAISAYGGSVPTPALDRLAADGVRFTHAYAHASWTRPSIASLFCGCLPSEHGVGQAGRRLAPEFVTVAEAFAAAGWDTGALFNNINTSAAWALDQGFRTAVFRGPRYPWFGSALVSRTSVYAMVLGRVRGTAWSPSRPEHYYRVASEMFADTLRWMDARGDRGWFLYVHLMEPHSPYFDGDDGSAWDRLGGERDDYVPADVATLQALYAREVRSFDAQLGAFLAELDRRGAYDGTTIVLVSDHGEEFHDHGGLWHGATLYDELVRVPLILKPAGGGSGVVDARVRLIDVAPTLARLSAVPVPPSWAGDDALGASEPRPVLLESVHEREMLRGRIDGSLKLIVADPGNGRGLPERALYDLAADPLERDNLAASRPDVVDRLFSALVIGDGGHDSAPVDAATREALKALGYVEE